MKISGSIFITSATLLALFNSFTVSQAAFAKGTVSLETIEDPSSSAAAVGAVKRMTKRKKTESAIGEEPTRWSQTTGCRRSVFQCLNFKRFEIVSPGASTAGFAHFTFDLKKNRTDAEIIGSGQGQLLEVGERFTSTGSYTFNGKGGFGRGEIFWVDHVTGFLGTADPSHSFVGDSAWAITGGHGDFRCATGWVDLAVDMTTLTYQNGLWDGNTANVIWECAMYTCGVCEYRA